MFTGLTNQVTSWMGSAKKGDEEEKPTSPNAEESAAPPAEEAADAKKENSSGVAGVGGRLEMLSNVKSQMSGWLGSGIPGLRKTEESAAAPGDGPAAAAGAPGAAPGETESPASERSVKGSPGDPKEDGDDSSATGGADSEGPPTDDEGDDKDAATGSVTTKAVQGAKSLGSFLYSAVNKAGKTVSESAAKIKKTVEENENKAALLVHKYGSFLSDFNKEQDQFIAEKGAKESAASVPPWVGYRNEESLKAECLGLSSDRRNFVRDPPAGVDFTFDLDASMPVALAVLAEDPNLEKMRFELVPKVVSEEVFWRNYFYRVNLLCQKNELSNMATDSGSANIGNRQGSTDAEPAVKTPDEVNHGTTKADVDNALGGDFVSDDFHISTKDLDVVRQDMQKLGIGLGLGVNSTEEWEKELEEELQEYEMVADSDGQATSAAGASSGTANWENQIEDMLDEEMDLK